MGQVTVEGGDLPAAGVDLRRGERCTVEVTSRIRRLVRIGALEVVSGSLDADPTPEPDQLVEVEPEPDPTPDSPHGEPSRRGTSEQWRKFVADNIPGLTEDDVADKGRDALIGAWDRYQQQVHGGS